uniref:Jmjc domain containing protein n=1 Tax=Neospora caninum (strain Liverpool) TaxID=572307 RepID=A0A0F7UGM7_NEOCL|nr:TPA: jmjc domain containing protein [Neospora caninum Liverpool]
MERNGGVRQEEGSARRSAEKAGSERLRRERVRLLRASGECAEPAHLEGDEGDAALSCRRCRFLRALHFFGTCFFSTSELSRLLEYFQREAAADRDADLPQGLRLLFWDALEAFREAPLCLLPAFGRQALFSELSGAASHSARTGEEKNLEPEDPREKDRDGHADAAGPGAEAVSESHAGKEKGEEVEGEGAPDSGASFLLSPASAAAPCAAVADPASSFAPPSGVSSSSRSVSLSAVAHPSLASACSGLCVRVRRDWLAETKERVDALHMASWRALHAGKWSDVPQAFRALYAFSAFCLSVLFAANAAADGEWRGAETEGVPGPETQDERSRPRGAAQGNAQHAAGPAESEKGEELEGEESDEETRDAGTHAGRGRQEPYSRLAFRYADLGLIMGGPETPVYDLLQSVLSKLDAGNPADSPCSSTSASESSSSISSSAPSSPSAGAAPLEPTETSRKRRRSENESDGRRAGDGRGAARASRSRWGMRPVPSVEGSELSFSDFFVRAFTPQQPLLIRGGAAHWPAISKWRDWSFLRKKLGDRLLPVEVGEAYTADDWGQTLMRGETLLASILQPQEDTEVDTATDAAEPDDSDKACGRSPPPGESLYASASQSGQEPERAFAAGVRAPGARQESDAGREENGDAEGTDAWQTQGTTGARKRLGGGTRKTSPRQASPAPILYMAQHALLEQVPALASDCPTPDFALCAAHSDTLIRLAWIGPRGTVSPAHTDEWQNFFVQVVGRKRFQLYPPEASASLYPFPKGPLTNTSGVPLERFLEGAEDPEDGRDKTRGRPDSEPEWKETQTRKERHGSAGAQKRRRLFLPPPRAASSLPDEKRAEETEEDSGEANQEEAHAKLPQTTDREEVYLSREDCVPAPETRKTEREDTPAFSREEGRREQRDREGDCEGRGLHAFPLFDRKKGFEVEVHPGDVLFIPKLWWHLVLAETASVSLSHWVN